MQECEVILTWEAIYDVTDIADYIEAEFGQNRADRFQEDIKKEMKKLGYIGGGFPKTRILYRNYTIHKKPFPPSIIFYILMEEKKGSLYSKGIAGGTQLAEYIEKDKELYLSNITFMQEGSKKAIITTV